MLHTSFFRWWAVNGWKWSAGIQGQSVPCTFRWKLKLMGAGFPSATHFSVTLSPSTRGSWAMTCRAMFSVESGQTRWGGGGWLKSGERVKWSVCPLQLAGETAETYSVAAPKRVWSCCLWPFYMQQSWLNLSDIYGHRSRSFKPQLFCCIWDKHFCSEGFPANDKFNFRDCILNTSTPHLKTQAVVM